VLPRLDRVHLTGHAPDGSLGVGEDARSVVSLVVGSAITTATSPHRLVSPPPPPPPACHCTPKFGRSGVMRVLRVFDHTVSINFLSHLHGDTIPRTLSVPEWPRDKTSAQFLKAKASSYSDRP
jgi:hypothetical protein